MNKKITVFLSLIFCCFTSSAMENRFSTKSMICFMIICRSYGFMTNRMIVNLSWEHRNILNSESVFKDCGPPELTKRVASFVKKRTALLQTIKRKEKKLLKTEIEVFKTFVGNKILAMNLKIDDLEDDLNKKDLQSFAESQCFLVQSLKNLSLVKLKK